MLVMNGSIVVIDKDQWLVMNTVVIHSDQLLVINGVIMVIRRPRPQPRQGRRLGPPEVWNHSRPTPPKLTMWCLLAGEGQ